jgi:hypothetical protein
MHPSVEAGMLEIGGIALILGGGALSRWAWSNSERGLDLFGRGLCIIGLLIVIVDAWR